MVIRVAQQALKSGASRVIIATEDQAITEVANQYQIESVITANTHASGTDRLAEAARKLRLPDEEIIVNVQGDEPFIEPALIHSIAQLLHHRDDCPMGTAAHPIQDPAEFLNPNVVKLTCDQQGRVLTFSRAPIPYPRDVLKSAYEQGSDPVKLLREQGQQTWGLRHIGIYSYRNKFLQQFAALPVAASEQVEALEQLRVLEQGERIAVFLTPSLPAPGIDTPEDLERARRLLR